jgi:nuclear RNA export factor
MHNMGRARMSRGRANNGGIRKRGTIRLDRDGDLDMSSNRALPNNRASQHSRPKGHVRIRGGKQSKAGTDTKAQMTAVLNKRYHQPTKVLDLSSLATDPDLVAMGLFNSTSTESKFFPALMRVWEMNFDNSEKSRAAVDSVTLANNRLANISPITTLSQTFPNLKNLDLSNNDFKDAQALEGWRWKFRQLEFLDLSGTPFSLDPSFKNTMLKWYPRLKTLNNTCVRTVDEAAAQRKMPILIQPAYFQDDSRIAENFVTAFFVGYDKDRNDLINQVYDNNSTFSLNVNNVAPRASQDPTPGWDHYIKKSRNILKISHLQARMSRAYVGAEKIREAWNNLPKTKHPDITGHPEDWLIECHSIPGLPDPTGQCITGVGGLIVTVHGKFDELGTSKIEMRSFDRTFVLGPGGGAGGLRVICDMLTLRAYGGHGAWDPDNQSTLPHPVPPQTKEQMILEVSFKTRMTLEYSEMALLGNNWDTQAALRDFEELRVSYQDRSPNSARH